MKARYAPMFEKSMSKISFLSVVIPTALYAWPDAMELIKAQHSTASQIRRLLAYSLLFLLTPTLASCSRKQSPHNATLAAVSTPTTLPIPTSTPFPTPNPQKEKEKAWKTKFRKRSKYDYPTSKSFLRPDGKPAPALEEYLKVKIFPGDKDVLINQGEVPHDGSKVIPFQYLSPVIRMYPKESKFRMWWDVHVAQYQGFYELNYYRNKGELTVTLTNRNWPDRPQTQLLGRYLTDRDIHEAGLDAAKNWTDFEEWATKHWEQ